jgi:exonuclease VII large subunit
VRKQGVVINQVAQVQVGDALEIRLLDGVVSVQACESSSESS